MYVLAVLDDGLTAADILIDNNQYSNWNRTRRLAMPPFVARVDTSTSRTAAALARSASAPSQGDAAPRDVIINMADLIGTAETAGSNSDANGRQGQNKDTLFGPSIGIVGAGPDWAAVSDEDDETRKEDVLTPEVVKGWIAKSKQVSSHFGLFLSSVFPSLRC